MRNGWDCGMPSARELWRLQESCEKHYNGTADPIEREPVKVGKEWRITVGRDYVYFKKMKDAKEALDNGDNVIYLK